MDSEFNQAQHQLYLTQIPEVFSFYLPVSVFFGLIPEGSNKEYIARFHRLDGDDYFGILLRVAATDCIGAVQIKAA